MTATTQTLTFSPVQNLTRYYQQIKKYPMLEPDEEYMLAKRFAEHEEEEAAHRLVSSHLRLVAKIADGYRGYGLPMGEIISEGNVGLMQAVRRFDPERGFRLSTYAMWWIRAAIQEYILRTWSLVKVGTTAAQKKLFFNLRKLKNKMKIFDEGDLTPANNTRIAERLDVPEKAVTSMNRRMGGQDHSLNAPLKIDGQGEWQDWLTDDSVDQEYAVGEWEEYRERKKLMLKAMSKLKSREKHIVVERRLRTKSTTLEVLSQHYNVSRERIRQIEVRAVEKMQAYVKKQIKQQKMNM